MKTPVQLRGYSRLLSAALARCSIEVCADSKMMRDSDRAYSKSVTMLGIDKARNSA